MTQMLLMIMEPEDRSDMNRLAYVMELRWKSYFNSSTRAPNFICSLYRPVGPATVDTYRMHKDQDDIFRHASQQRYHEFV